MKLLITLLLLLPLVPFAQSLSMDNTGWRSETLYDSADRASMPFNSEFRVYPSKKKIDWLQNNGSYVTTFTINEVQGRWNDIRNDGSAVFLVTYFGKNGEIRIERSGSTSRIGLKIMEGGKNLLPLSFSISKSEAL